MGIEQLHSGEIYYPTDDSIMEVQLKCLDKLYDFNATRPSELDKRMAIMKKTLRPLRSLREKKGIKKSPQQTNRLNRGLGGREGD